MNNFFPQQGQQQVNGMGMYGQPQYWPGTYNYQMQQPVAQLPVMTNPMTEEEHKMLQASNGFNVTRNKLDAIRDLCTHKHNGQFTIFQRDDGLFECSYCGKVWEMLENLSREEVDDIVIRVNNLIETIKTFTLDASPDVARNFYMALGFIDLLPGMYEYAMNNKNKLINVHGMNPAGTMGAASQTWNALNGLMSGMPMYNQGYYTQPAWGPAPTAPMGAPAPGVPMGQPQPAWAPAPAAPMGAPAPGVPMGQPQQTWGPQFATQAGSPADRPVGVVVPNGPAPMPAPGMVVSDQVATTGPAPMQQTAANVPPVAPVSAATETPAKTFKA